MRERMATEVTMQLRDELLEGMLLGHTTEELAVRERAQRWAVEEYQICPRLQVTEKRDYAVRGQQLGRVQGRIVPSAEQLQDGLFHK